MDSKPSKRILKKLREERIRRLLKKEEMPTILDAYLYGLAMRRGKWLGAVEDVKDQLNLADEIGKEIGEEENNLSDDKLLITLEKMIGIYLEQDLNVIEEYALNYGNARVRKQMFINRNIKMARSMDSLSKQRSMFYAVGAAHLPGDSGVIKLLRNKGYILTPVFSVQKIAAEKFTENLAGIPWEKIEEEEKLYSIEMPGKPGNHKMFGELVKMKVFIDITTLSVYMTGHTIAQFEDKEIEARMKAMAKGIGGGRGKMENFKKINRGSLIGGECMSFGDGYYYRVQMLKQNNLVFILMLGNQRKQELVSADADKYFNSFKTGAVPVAADVKNWKEFGLADKAFTVAMPAQPKRNKAYEKQADGTSWNFTAYDCTDLAAGLYYILQVRDIEAGYFLDGDSAYFSLVKENMEKNISEVVKEETGIYEGFPSYRYDAVSGKEGLFYKSFTVIRGNRVYSLIALGEVNKKDQPGPEAFFRSLRFTEYASPGWKMHMAGDETFTAWGGAPFIFKSSAENKTETDDEEDSDSSRRHYISYNKNNAISYEVLKDPFPEYFWISDDSAYFREKADGYKNYTDSIVKYERISNGNLKGAEVTVKINANNNLKKIRILIHGDTLITLISFIPRQYINDVNHLKFFSEFRVKNDRLKATVFTNKAEALVNALQSADSVTFAKATTALGAVNFTKADLPVLHQALLKTFPDDSSIYYSVRTRIVNALRPVSDSSTVDFIRKNYHTLKNDKESDKMSLLDVLVNCQTNYSYSLLKDLLVNYPPQKLKEGDALNYQINDSLELTKTLFPELLSLIKNPLYWTQVTGYTSRLVDSNMLKIEEVRPFEKDLLFNADTLLHSIPGQEEFYAGSYTDMLHLLGRLNSEASNKMLQQYVKLEDKDLKQESVTRLLENSQAVDAREIEKLAADKAYRSGFYERLRKINKQHFFTPGYLTQKFFAESEAYTMGYDEYEPEAVEYLSDKEVEFDGKKQRVFLFRIGYSAEDEESKSSSYLAVVGPYPLDIKKIETNGDVSDIYWDEEYDKKKVSKHFAELMKRAEEYVKKKKETVK